MSSQYITANWDILVCGMKGAHSGIIMQMAVLGQSVTKFLHCDCRFNHCGLGAAASAAWTASFQRCERVSLTIFDVFVLCAATEIYQKNERDLFFTNSIVK